VTSSASPSQQPKTPVRARDDITDSRSQVGRGQPRTAAEPCPDAIARRAPVSTLVAQALADARAGLYGKNDGWLNAMQIRNVLVNGGQIEQSVAMGPIRRALRVLPVEQERRRRLTYYRLEETSDDLQPVLLCTLCRSGAGGQCHTPGCALWMNRAPDVPVMAWSASAR
jgi:hypothetical protein